MPARAGPRLCPFFLTLVREFLLCQRVCIPRYSRSVTESELRRHVELLPRDVAALFAADCAERVLPLFEVAYPDDNRPRKAIEVAHLGASVSIARAAALAAHAAARVARDDGNVAATHAARAAGHAAATIHVATHAISAARYATHAAGEADPGVEVLKGIGTIAFRRGDSEAAERAFEARLDIAERGGDQRQVADACADMARLALRRGNFQLVRDYAERGCAAAQGVGPDAVRGPLHMLAAAARMEGRFADARSHYLESRSLNERLGDERRVAGEDHNLIYVALHTGDREEAERRYRASSAWIFAHEDAYLRPYSLLDAGVLAVFDHDFERAASLVAAARRIFDESGSIPDPDDQVELDGAVARLKVELGERFALVWAGGQTMSLADARTLAQK
jgi:hypothetical protein